MKKQQLNENLPTSGKKRGRPTTVKSIEKTLLCDPSTSTGLSSLLKSGLVANSPSIWIEITNKTPQDRPKHIFIDEVEATERFYKNEPCEVLVKQFATDQEGGWTLFDPLWLSFPNGKLKFRKPV
jgi:hypothetical protein